MILSAQTKKKKKNPAKSLDMIESHSHLVLQKKPSKENFEE
jgi:hypothetical protein